MKKKLSKKLSLGKRSIAILSDEAADGLRGGGYSQGCPGGGGGGSPTRSCPTRGCPPSPTIYPSATCYNC